MIEVDGVARSFGGHRAVDDVSFAVAGGEIVGLLGPNGSGKTTTIRVLLGLLRPTAGEVALLGHPPHEPASRARVGYLPGDLVLDPKMNGWEHLELFATLRGGVSERRARDLCELFGLDPTRPARELSKGNRQKVGIVQAFMSDPELLILDEPTSGLDPLQQQAFHDLLSEAKGAGAAVFLSSPVLPEVERVADRVGIIRAGKVVAVTTIDDLRRTARQRLTITVATAPDAGLVLGAIDGVLEGSVDGQTVHVLVEGALQPMLDALSRFGIVRVTSHDDDLDDLFLGFYR